MPHVSSSLHATGRPHGCASNAGHHIHRYMYRPACLPLTTTHRIANRNSKLLMSTPKRNAGCNSTHAPGLSQQTALYVHEHYCQQVCNHGATKDPNSGGATTLCIYRCLKTQQSRVGMVPKTQWLVQHSAITQLPRHARRVLSHKTHKHKVHGTKFQEANVAPCTTCLKHCCLQPS